jgi:hypothetical protein
MKKIIFTLLILFLVFISKAQELPKRMANFTIGATQHGTGDIIGVSLHLDYANYYTKRISGILEFGFSIHDGSDPLFYEFPQGNIVNSSILYTTAGIQLNLGMAYDFIRTSKHELQVRLSSLYRYQSTSLYDEVGIYYLLPQVFRFH